MSQDATPKGRHQVAINTVRFLAVDMVERANSGHPGAPMGLAALATTLWTHQLRFHPPEPEWPNRDRFVLSCGHASALLYALLHVAGYDLPVDELRNFRQLGSKTPGHPEHGLTPGVETTTGPLGQGLANAVGMAIAERLLAERFNQDGFALFDHHVYVIVSDGDLMEGVSAEASSLAGHLGLGKLVVFYDDNKITIDGGTELAFSEDVAARYAAYGWHTLDVADGNDTAAITAAIDAANAETVRPTLVRVRTTIGYGAPNKQDTSGVHGSPLGAEEIVAAKRNLGWDVEALFQVGDEARETFAPARERGAKASAAWHELLGRYTQAHPELAAELRRRLAGDLPEGWEEKLPRFAAEDGNIATRKASGATLNALATHVPELLGGSADLAPSNNTWLKGEAAFSAAEAGRNFHFGVREHAMAAAMNGMALSGLRPYGGTFLVFSDYMRPSLRLAAMMELGVIYVLTHDSLFLGEDGPTHQPESHLASLRALPGLAVLRPADANETAAAWAVALQRQQAPTALALTRQGLPVLPEAVEKARQGVARGAYVLVDPPAGTEPQVILIASGSEIQLVWQAQRVLLSEGIAARVVSMPSWELFDAQDDAYRESVLPAAIPLRLAVEAGSPLGWHKYTGTAGDVLAQNGWGASAPCKALAEHYGFTIPEVVRRAKALVV
jgi:transketolase